MSNTSTVTPYDSRMAGAAVGAGFGLAQLVSSG